jgi:hypothetical protein
MVIAHLCREESAILSQEADFCQGRHHYESVRATKPNWQGTSQRSYSNSYNILKKPLHCSSLYLKGWNQVWHGFFQVSIIVCPCRHTTTNPTARDEFSTFPSTFEYLNMPFEYVMNYLSKMSSYTRSCGEYDYYFVDTCENCCKIFVSVIWQASNLAKMPTTLLKHYLHGIWLC